jgi:hypothetical protein
MKKRFKEIPFFYLRISWDASYVFIKLRNEPYWIRPFHSLSDGSKSLASNVVVGG